MKPNLWIAPLLVLFVFFASCGSDDDEPAAQIEVNVPPSEVTNIQAEVVQGTTNVILTWDAATDENGDELAYEVIVNNKRMAENLTTTSLEIDVEEFITNQANKTVAKNGIKDFAKNAGFELVLGIEIKAYDGNGSFSTESVVSTLNVNRAPGEFEFENIYFNLDNLSFLEISWTPSTDKDGDSITYNVYLNEIEIVKDYVMEEYRTYGTVYYYENFGEFIDEEMVVKVVASDGSGQTTEISQSYNFRETDVDLGELTIPHEGNMDFVIDADEQDDRVGYTFSISETSGYLFSITSSNSHLILKDANDNRIASSYGTINGGELLAGTYYLELRNNSYNNSSVSGTLSIMLKDATVSDVDLGIVPAVHEESLAFDLAEEIDNKIVYSFEMDEDTGYVFTTDTNVNIELFDSNGNRIYNYYYSHRELRGELSAGQYRIEVSSYYNNQQGSLNLQFKDPKATDKDLGIFDASSFNEVAFDFENEPDNKMVFTFQIGELTGYSFYSDTDLDYQLYDSNKNFINSDKYNRINGRELLPGTYLLEISHKGDASGILNMAFSDPDTGDVDFGILQLPYDQSHTFTFRESDADNVIKYYFETTESFSYSMSQSSNFYINLRDINGNYIHNGYSINGSDLPLGKYVIEVSVNYSFINSINGNLNVQINQN